MLLIFIANLVKQSGSAVVKTADFQVSSTLQQKKRCKDSPNPSLETQNKERSSSLQVCNVITLTDTGPTNTIVIHVHGFSGWRVE